MPKIGLTIAAIMYSNLEIALGPLVDGQHVFRAGQEGHVHCPRAPVLLAVGRQLVFLSTLPHRFMRNSFHQAQFYDFVGQ